MKKALISGITGQDGSYLAELLLSKGYEVHGIIRRASTFNTARLNHVYVDPHSPGVRLFLHYGDLADSEQISNIVYNIKPDEIYHLGAQSHVRVSFDIPEYTSTVTGISTTRFLEAIRHSGLKTKFYQASSSEIFGLSEAPQNEMTQLRPRSPYACAKAYAHQMARNYRNGYRMFISNGILFNHESPRRGETFVTRKITIAIASILANRQNKLFLGDLDAKRDWGYAPEYVEMMWRILQQKLPDDFVIGTGRSNSVKEFVEEAFSYAGLNWKKYVKMDPNYLRPTETAELLANTSKARKVLGWRPKASFKDLVKIMVDADMRAAGLKPIGESDKILREKFPNRWWAKD
ncbi:MAG: GDP-mannose 4,6-dehydratase [Candidatus Omnitrophota bacterium]